MQIAEPVTMLTDYALGILTSVWAARLFRFNHRDRQLSRLLWAMGFVATATAAFAGGTFHGFKAHLLPEVAIILWKCTVYSVGVIGWMMLSAIVATMTSEGRRRLLLGFVTVKFVVYALWMTFHSEFRFVICDYGLAMVAILSAQIFAWRVQHAPGAQWIICGIAICFLAAWIQSSRISFHHHFNHNDLFHVVQMLGLYFLYRGGLRLVDHQRTNAAQVIH